MIKRKNQEDKISIKNRRIGVVAQGSQQQVIDNIARTISENGRKFKVGHVGLPGFMETLVDHGLGEVVYKAVNTTEFPGWGYMISQGATTVWEGWNLKNGGFEAEESMMMLAGVDRFFMKVSSAYRSPKFLWHTRVRTRLQPNQDQATCARRSDLRQCLNKNSQRNHIIGLEENRKFIHPRRHYPRKRNCQGERACNGVENPTITEGGKVVWKDGTYVEGVAGITDGKQEAGYVTIDTGSGDYRFKIQ